MANLDHLKKLKASIEAWNQWRRENPDVKPDLSEAILRRAYFRGANFCDADLSGTSLSDANLRGADLSNANLSDANLSNANLSDANLSNANLSHANLKLTRLNKNTIIDNKWLLIKNLQIWTGNPITDENRIDEYKWLLLAKALPIEDGNRLNLSCTDLSRAALSRTYLRGADLRGADLRGANLSEANLSEANLSEAKLSGADLSNANLRRANLNAADLNAADLNAADLNAANLNAADLNAADLRNANLQNTNLRNATLNSADLSRANLRNANVSNANLRNTDLISTDLRSANLRNANVSNATLNSADLSNADLSKTQVLYTSFKDATLTGACLQDWQIGGSTSFEGVKCDYIFRSYDATENKFTDRLPVDPDTNFAPGEFEQWIAVRQGALDTIDITFTEGIDWQAFFTSFQELRQQRPDDEVSIQGIERKGQAFVVRLEVPQEADKGAIETQAKQLYETQLKALEAQYEERLRLQSEEIAHHRQAQSSLLHIVQTMAEKDSISQNFHGPVGNVAATNKGIMQAIQHNYGASVDDINRLIKTLRSQVETFPTEQKEEASDVLDDLQGDLAKDNPDPNRISRRLKRLAAIATAVGAIATGTAAFSGDVKDVVGNIVELGQVLGVEIIEAEQSSSGD